MSHLRSTWLALCIVEKRYYWLLAFPHSSSRSLPPGTNLGCATFVASPLAFCSALKSCTVSACCGCLSAGLLRKDVKFSDSSFERDPLVAAGIVLDGVIVLRFVFRALET